MRGSEFIATLPPGPGPQREQMILDAVLAGDWYASWVPITVQSENMSADFLVSSDKLMSGEPGDYVRVNCTQPTAQLIADHLNCVLPTSQLCDQIYAHADLKLEPILRSNWMGDNPKTAKVEGDGSASTSRRMLDYSRLVDEAIGGRDYGLVANVSKDWINTDKFGVDPNRVPRKYGQPVECNYGWYKGARTLSSDYLTTIPGMYVWQGPGTAHDWNHTDYSQMVRLVARAVHICQPVGISGFGGEEAEGQPCTLPNGGQGAYHVVDIYEMPHVPEWSRLLSRDTRPYIMRHPLVPWAGGVAIPFDPAWRPHGPARPSAPAPVSPAAVGTAGKVAALLAGGIVGYSAVNWLRRR